MGKFSSKPSAPAAPAPVISEEKVNVEQDKAASRLRLAEKRRKG